MTSKHRVYRQARNAAVPGIIQAYMQLHPETTIDELRTAFPDSLTDKGMDEIFITGDFTGKDKDYFIAEDELIDTPSGKVAVAKLWSDTAFDNLVKKAADYGIEVPKTEPPHYTPHDLDYPPKRGSLKWLWILLAIIVIAAIVLSLTYCNRSEPAIAMKRDTIKITNTVTEVEPAVAETEGAPVTANPELVAQVDKLEKEFDSLEFPTGRTDISTKARKVLDKLASLMKANPEMRLDVNGYASPEGGVAVNDRISRLRAEHVVDYLESRGVAADHLKAIGRGTENQISEQLPPNRRVEFVVL